MVTDEDLMRNWQLGDRAALDDLALRYYQAIYRYLMRVTGQHHLAEDLTQECFVRLVRCGRHYQYPRPLRPWLYTIATNTMRRHFESAYQRHTALLDTLPEEVAGRDETPHLMVGQWSDRQELLCVLQQLSAEHREVVTLRYAEDFSLAEIAAILGMPLGTVKTRLMRALRRLRLLLEGRQAAQGEDTRDAV